MESIFYSAMIYKDSALQGFAVSATYTSGVFQSELSGDALWKYCMNMLIDEYSNKKIKMNNIHLLALNKI